MNLLALDPATRTGWCARTEGFPGNFGHIERGVYRPELERVDPALDRGESHGQFYLAWGLWLEDTIAYFKPSVLVYEQQFLAPTAHTTELMFALIGMMKAACARWKIRPLAVNPNALKLWATGYGNATKREMLDAARKWGAFPPHEECRIPEKLRGTICAKCKKSEGKKLKVKPPHCPDPIHDEVDAMLLLYYALERLEPKA